MGFILNIINGLYSGIPVCCILFFSKRDLKKHNVALETDIERGLTVVAEGGGYRTIPPSINHYVRCNKCFNTNHRVEIKKNGGWRYSLKPFRIINWKSSVISK